MTKLPLFMAISIALGSLTVGCASSASNAQTCASMNLVKDNGRDATPIIAECLKNLTEGRALQLLPGRYQLLTPLVIDRSATIETALIQAGRKCSNNTGKHCAVLAIGQMPPQPTRGVMPIEVTAKNVRFNSIAIVAAGSSNAAWQQRICLDQHTRPLGGGVRVRADGFKLTNVLLNHASCYTAMEISKGVRDVKLINNVIGPNGNHQDNQMWSDGITIHDAIFATIENNIFRDNTDVQLVFGGCRKCKIKNNRFYHSDEFIHASFAELMLHAWPSSSGDFSGSITSGNSINCGPHRRCGYGLMIGGEPWYPSKAFGGTVTDNSVKNAQMGMNVDKLTGAMDIKENFVTNSGGNYNSDCGKKKWPDVNVSKDSIKFLVSKTTKYSSVITRKCLLNRMP